MNRSFVTTGISGAVAVALGALGAHALKNQLSGGLITAEQLNGFDTAVKYQMYHTLAMMLVLILNKENSKWLKLSYRFFLAGIVLFSGSLYFLCTRNLIGSDWLKFLGPVTPIGGLCFVAGWLSLAFASFGNKRYQ